MKRQILPILLILLLLPIAQAAFVGHTADSITAGTFKGNFDVEGTLNPTTTTGFTTTYVINKDTTPMRKGELVSITFDEPTNIRGDILFGIIKASNNDPDIIGIVYTAVNDDLRPTEDTQIQPGQKLLIATQGPIEQLRVTTENGAIVPGDYLTPSNRPGYAMKADETSNILLGRALGTAASGDSLIPAFISITTNDRVTNINQERLQKYDTLPKTVSNLGIKKEPLGSTEQQDTSLLQQQINALQQQIKQLQEQLANLFGQETTPEEPTPQPENPLPEPVINETPINHAPEINETITEPAQPIIDEPAPEEPETPPEKPEVEEPGIPETTRVIQLVDENVIVRIG